MASPPMTVRALSLLPRVRGMASSFTTFVFMVLFSISSGVIGPLLYDSALKLALGMGVGSIISMLLWFGGTRADVPDRAFTVPE
jgi:DHA1 family bicyclomycin/chloramphenicol resistance-like MFS transporter